MAVNKLHRQVHQRGPEPNRGALTPELMAKTDLDTLRELGAAVMERAVLDAKAGDPDAWEFIANDSPLLALWTALAGVDSETVRAGVGPLRLRPVRRDILDRERCERRVIRCQTCPQRIVIYLPPTRGKGRRHSRKRRCAACLSADFTTGAQGTA